MYSFEGNLHTANQGAISMLARARQTMYWPGMDQPIRNHTDTCIRCREIAPSDPLIPALIPEYPFQNVVTDLFEINKHHYIAYVDRFTGFAEFAHYPYSPNSSTIINTIRQFYHRWGAAEEISLDGGGGGGKSNIH